jgi:hypothetical protein
MWPRARAALGGTVLLVSLFVPWYRAPEGAVRNESGIHVLVGLDTGSAWEVLTALDVALALLAIVIVAVPRLTGLAACVAVGLIAGRLLESPWFGFMELAVGGFLGLAGALLAAWPDEPRRFTVTGAGGLVLLVSLALPWYDLEPFEIPPGTPLAEFEFEEGVGAWEQFAVIDLALAGFAVLALATVWFEPAARAVRTFGWIAIVLVVARLVWPPVADVAPAVGAWIALAGAVVAFAGAWPALSRAPEPDVA